MLSAKRNKIIFPSSAAETIANNDDLLIQILLCLPIKSLFKFKSVSKHWLSLITNPLFSRRLFPFNSPCALFVRKSFRLENEFDFIMIDDKYSIDAPFKTLEFIDDTIRIIQSCNGLLLCSSVQFYLPEAKYYVYNPTTNQYAILPPLTGSADEICGLYLAFDPLKSPNYKVIRLLQSEISEPDFQIEIYSSKINHEWKVSNAGFTLESLDIGTHDGVFCNGAIHWYTDFGPSFYFDVDKEQVKEMAMPATPEEWYRRRVLYFRECRGHLYLVEIYNAPSTKFNVWEMEKDYSGWIVKYRIDLDGIVRAFPGMIRSYLDPSALNYYVFQIMYIVKGERDEDEEDDGSYLVLHIPTKIIRYNLKDKSFKKLCDFNPYEQEDASYMIHYGAYEYIQSLACV
ncbi:hypothetical protein JCGZ_19593 [Jatropha curcas]|uniref:F-box domain-containing protein n=1 Tax=Jatropha curcas TaxID=180498 RepID=A0A067JXN9_JATCU|nr:hypothetical protein JCGZ_19593 [Jatropha curcas]